MIWDYLLKILLKLLKQYLKSRNKMDFEQKLMNKYPELFHKKEDGSLECLCGVWVPEGWETIVDELCGCIHDYTTKTYRLKNGEKVYPPAVKIDQIKEKFGGLRFYYFGGDDQVDGMVTFASYLASKTCEVSGEKGELCSNRGWYKTLSPKIREENPYNNYKSTKQ
jgi:hypothetical protein